MNRLRTPGIRPRPTIWRQLDAAARSSFPAACTALLLLALAAPLGIPGQAQLQPAAALACVFFWSMFRPASMPAPVVFALGLLSDLLGLGQLGVGVVTLLLTHGIAWRSRRILAEQGFLLVWLVFIGVAACAAALTWALTSLFLLQPVSVTAALFQFGLAAGAYPLFSTVFTAAHRGLADPDQA